MLGCGQERAVQSGPAYLRLQAAQGGHLPEQGVTGLRGCGPHRAILPMGVGVSACQQLAAGHLHSPTQGGLVFLHLSQQTGSPSCSISAPNPKAVLRDIGYLGPWFLSQGQAGTLAQMYVWPSRRTPGDHVHSIVQIGRIQPSVLVLINPVKKDTALTNPAECGLGGWRRHVPLTQAAPLCPVPT